jgi:23S rRNA (cytosine1962-C5)-methyltransferase
MDQKIGLHENKNLLQSMESALNFRFPFLDLKQTNAIRLYNGFFEGFPEFSIELYGKTLLIHDYTKDPLYLSPTIQAVQDFYLAKVPLIESIIVKTHRSASVEHKRGVKIWGSASDSKITENGIWYALDLCINNDTSFYIDTRNLRYWTQSNLHQASVLNTFAYTGSFGVAARLGGASRVIHIDQSKAYLSLAKESYRLNDLEFLTDEFRVGNFFTEIARLKSLNFLFDCIFLDPPYFSQSPSGRVDANNGHIRLINKVRPLVAHNGYLVSVNNAIFLSGEDYLKLLSKVCADNYLSIEELIPVPEDCIGNPLNNQQTFHPRTTPFNHSTKIAILRVKRKDQRVSNL